MKPNEKSYLRTVEHAVPSEISNKRDNSDYQKRTNIEHFYSAKVKPIFHLRRRSQRLQGAQTAFSDVIQPQVQELPQGG